MLFDENFRGTWNKWLGRSIGWSIWSDASAGVGVVLLLLDVQPAPKKALLQFVITSWTVNSLYCSPTAGDIAKVNVSCGNPPDLTTILGLKKSSKFWLQKQFSTFCVLTLKKNINFHTAEPQRLYSPSLNIPSASSASQRGCFCMVRCVSLQDKVLIVGATGTPSH